MFLLEHLFICLTTACGGSTCTVYCTHKPGNSFYILPPFSGHTVRHGNFHLPAQLMHFWRIRSPGEVDTSRQPDKLRDVEMGDVEGVPWFRASEEHKDGARTALSLE